MSWIVFVTIRGVYKHRTRRIVTVVNRVDLPPNVGS
jgi:hypothetical protein